MRKEALLKVCSASSSLLFASCVCGVRHGGGRDFLAFQLRCSFYRTQREQRALGGIGITYTRKPESCSARRPGGVFLPLSQRERTQSVRFVLQNFLTHSSPTLLIIRTTPVWDLCCCLRNEGLIWNSGRALKSDSPHNQQFKTLRADDNLGFVYTQFW